MGNYNEGYNNESQYECQHQTMKQKSKLKQLNRHKDACETLMYFLMSLENFALRDSDKRILGKYDNFDNVKYKSETELRNQVIGTMDCAIDNYNRYKKKYKTFHFPKNFSSADMIKKISEWKHYVKRGDQKYYDNAIDLLNGFETENYMEDYVDENENENENEEKEIKEFVDNLMFKSSEDQKEFNNIKEKYEKGEDYKYKVIFNGERGAALKKKRRGNEEIDKEKMEIKNEKIDIDKEKMVIEKERMEMQKPKKEFKNSYEKNNHY